MLVCVCVSRGHPAERSGIARASCLVRLALASVGSHAKLRHLLCFLRMHPPKPLRPNHHDLAAVPRLPLGQVLVEDHPPRQLAHATEDELPQSGAGPAGLRLRRHHHMCVGQDPPVRPRRPTMRPSKRPRPRRGVRGSREFPGHCAGMARPRKEWPRERGGLPGTSVRSARMGAR